MHECKSLSPFSHQNQRSAAFRARLMSHERIEQNLFRLPVFGNLYRQRELLWQFTLRRIHMQHRGSYLGAIWEGLNPLLMLALYTFIFGIILNGHFGVHENETSIEYSLGIFIGLTTFNLLAGTISGSPLVILDNPNLVKKVVFPLEVLPSSTVLASIYNFLISLALCLLGISLFGPGLTLAALCGSPLSFSRWSSCALEWPVLLLGSGGIFPGSTASHAGGFDGSLLCQRHFLPGRSRKRGSSPGMGHSQIQSVHSRHRTRPRDRSLGTARPSSILSPFSGDRAS